MAKDPKLIIQLPIPIPLPEKKEGNSAKDEKPAEIVVRKKRESAYSVISKEGNGGSSDKPQTLCRITNGKREEIEQLVESFANDQNPNETEKEKEARRKKAQEQAEIDEEILAYLADMDEKPEDEKE